MVPGTLELDMNATPLVRDAATSGAETSRAA
jgi:hypothetical protein